MAGWITIWSQLAFFFLELDFTFAQSIICLQRRVICSLHTRLGSKQTASQPLPPAPHLVNSLPFRESSPRGQGKEAGSCDSAGCSAPPTWLAPHDLNSQCTPRLLCSASEVSRLIFHVQSYMSSSRRVPPFLPQLPL